MAMEQDVMELFSGASVGSEKADTPRNEASEEVTMQPEDEVRTEEISSETKTAKKDPDESGSELKELSTEEQIAALRAQIVELSTKTDTPKKEEPAQEKVLDDEDWLGELDPQELLSDKASFNGLLNRLHKSAYDKAKADAQEALLKSIPGVIKAQIAEHATMKKLVDKFLEDNADLDNEDLKPFMAKVVTELAAANAEWSPEEVFKAAGPEIRKRLGLKAAAQKKAEKQANPGFAPVPGGAGNQKKAPNLSKMEREVQAMFAN